MREGEGDKDRTGERRGERERGGEGGEGVFDSMRGGGSEGV